jgi:anti-sigma B factor antagonist
MKSQVVCVIPQGRLDAAGAQPLETNLNQHIAAGENRILVSLNETRYISSNGLRVLLAALKTTRKHGGTVKLCCLSSRLREIFEMSGFDRVFEIYETREQAEQSFQN